MGALGIDTKHLIEKWIPDHENHLDDALGRLGRFQMWRVFALAKVIHDPSMMRHLSVARGRPLSGRKQAILDWQPDQDDEQKEWEVFRHLDELCETSMSFPDASNFVDVARPLVTSAESSSFSARAQGRPPSSFRRYSIKISMLRNDRNEAYGMYLITHTDLQKLFPNIVRHGSWCKWGYEPKIFCSNTRHKCAVFWQMQIDFVDLLDRQPPASSRLKKRRRTINQFLQVSDGAHHHERAVSGVRHRRDRRKPWVAEMKPPGSKNKVSFGDFKSQTEAARAVDAAFYYYGKSKRLNFTDTPQILATRPAPVGEKEKLRFVKDQAQWLASMASTLQPSLPSSSSTPSPTSDVTSPVPFKKAPHPHPPCTPNSVGFRPLPGGCRVVDGGLISQPQLWISQPQHPTASIVTTNGVETWNPNCFSDEGQSESVATAGSSDIVMSQIADLDPDHGCLTMQITYPWDSLSEVDHSDCAFQITDSPFASAPAPNIDHVRSPYNCDFQGHGFPDRLMLEQQILWHE